MLEPSDHVGVNPQRELLLVEPKQQATPRAAPVTDFRYVSRIDMGVSFGAEICVQYHGQAYPAPVTEADEMRWSAAS
jgi:hypothetical protein